MHGEVTVSSKMSACTSRALDRLPKYARDAVLAVFSPEHVADAIGIMRSPSEIMTDSAMQRVKASRFSFARSFVERMHRERWEIVRQHCDIDENGAGLLVYQICAEGHTFTFAIRSDPLDDVQREGRARDTSLDFHGVIFVGAVGMERIKAEIPSISNVWGGRTHNDTIARTYGNRSNRFFNHAVEALAAGRQPDVNLLALGGGYLIRNAGYYGNGRMGCRSWEALPPDHPLSYPFYGEMLGLYIYRQASFEYVESMARCRNLNAAELSPDIKRYLGVGNQSGIGTAAALVRWPSWVSGFCFTRELVLALALTAVGPRFAGSLGALAALLARASRYYRECDPDIDAAVEDRRVIAAELDRIHRLIADCSFPTADAARSPLFNLFSAAAKWASPETMEQLVSLVIDSAPPIYDVMIPVMSAGMRSTRELDPSMTVGEFLALLNRDYDWALVMDQSSVEFRRYFWYRSEENGENRRGERAVDPGVEFETFVNVAGSVQTLASNLRACPHPEWTIGRYLLEYPDDAYCVTRVQTVSQWPYGEIRANFIAEAFNPSDIIRFYMSILGMETTNPLRKRWIRGVFMQGAPLPEDLLTGAHSDWALPVIPDQGPGPQLHQQGRIATLASHG
jgi:hypothetical protein